MGGCFRRERNWGELGPVSLHVSLQNIQMSCPKVRRTVSEGEALLQKRGNAEGEALYYKS